MTAARWSWTSHIESQSHPAVESWSLPARLWVLNESQQSPSRRSSEMQPPPESDNPMRRHLIRYLLERPFTPFIIRLEGGYEVSVLHHEFASLEPGVLVMTVFDRDGRAEIFSTERIVSLRLFEVV